MKTTKASNSQVRLRQVLNQTKVKAIRKVGKRLRANNRKRKRAEASANRNHTRLESIKEIKVSSSQRQLLGGLSMHCLIMAYTTLLIFFCWHGPLLITFAMSDGVYVGLYNRSFPIVGPWSESLLVCCWSGFVPTVRSFCCSSIEDSTRLTINSCMYGIAGGKKGKRWSCRCDILHFLT